MEAVGIVLNIGLEHVDAFEAGFSQYEQPIWDDYVDRGIMLNATLTRLDISTQPVPGAVQYLICVTFSDEQGHHIHDGDPRFISWNKMAEPFHEAQPIVTGGEVIVSAGIAG